jgi:hypothetical protein
MTTVQVWAQKVVRGELISGELMRVACQRHLDNFKRRDLYFDEQSGGLATLRSQ